MSAKLLRLKQLQNQLAEANLQVNELYAENRILRALQKRQDIVLDRYEGAHAQLPQLVNAHHEEVRVLRTKYRNLKAQYRDVSKKLKDRESELLNLKEQNSHLLKLSQDRHLGEREALSKQVLELQSTVNNQKNTIQVLNRKVLLETKNLKHQLHVEMQHHKKTQLELKETLMKMENLQCQLEQAKERQVLPVSMQRSEKSISQPCTRLPGLRRRVATTPLDKIRQGNSESHSNKLKTSFPDYSPQRMPQTTDPSSDQPDSSMATFSEKTNEYSTSVDSSPEHVVDVNSSSDTSSTGRVQKSIQVRSNVKNESPSRANTLPSGDLETEYKKALDMLTELSSKDRGDFKEEITCSLASADLVTAKHVAALANATFSLKDISKERSSSFGLSNTSFSKVDYQSLPSMKEFQHFNEGDSAISPQGERKKVFASMGDMGDVPHFEEGASDLDLLTEIKSSVSTKMPWEELTPNASDQFRLFENINAKGTFEKKTTVESSNSLHEDDEDFHKEALLKALKAIDDEKVLLDKDGSGTDDSDSGTTKEISKKGLPVTMFTSINSSSAVTKRTVEHPAKRRPFK